MMSDAGSKQRVEFMWDKHMNYAIDPPRELNDWERAVLDRLLSVPFPGHEAGVTQLPELRVDIACSHCPSVWFVKDVPATRPVVGPDGKPLVGILPCELEGHDVDGMYMSVLVHVRNGFLRGIDAFRGDLKPFWEIPDPARLDIVCGDPRSDV